MTHNDSGEQGRPETSTFLELNKLCVLFVDLMFIHPAHCFSFSISLSDKNLAGMTATLKSTVYELGDKNNRSLRQACCCNKGAFHANGREYRGGDVVFQKLLSNTEKNKQRQK